MNGDLLAKSGFRSLYPLVHNERLVNLRVTTLVDSDLSINSVVLSGVSDNQAVAPVSDVSVTSPSGQLQRPVPKTDESTPDIAFSAELTCVAKTVEPVESEIDNHSMSENAEKDETIKTVQETPDLDEGCGQSVIGDVDDSVKETDCPNSPSYSELGTRVSGSIYFLYFLFNNLCFNFIILSFTAR